MKLKILFVISVMNYGGAGKMLSFLANNLNRLGYEIVIYTYAGDNNHYFLDEKIEYIPEKEVYQNHFTKRVFPIFKVRKTIERTHPDLIISFLGNGNFLSILGHLSKGIPVIISERSDPYNEKNFSLSLMRLFYRFADGAVFQTEGAQEYYNNTVQKKSEVIPNPVTNKLEPKVSLDRRKNEIAFVGRFDIKQKRQDLMIETLKRITETHDEIVLVFYGDGPDTLLIKEMVRENNLTDNVIFAGKVSNVQECLKNSRLFVLTSDYEGIPNALIEAMSVGLPVVTTDCSPGGARSLVENKKNGLIVPTGNVDELSSSISFLLDNPGIAEQYGEEAQKIVEKFNPQKIVKMWDDYIKEIYNS